jgi:glyoxylase-like metal-dependent hydrolase (beta-lactamase superfamily II)
MTLTAIPTGPFQEICYIVWNDTRQALIFDPGHDEELILQSLKEHKLEVAAYVCTHGHADHISALATMHAAHPAPIAMHSKDWEWAFSSRNQIAPYYSVPKKPDDDSFLPLERTKDWHLGNLYFQRLETPGHTPGSCCLLFPENNILIAGDTLFKGSCGRTDLPGGNPRQLKESLNQLKQLPDEVCVFPGHGPDTTIGIERATNVYMR